MLHERYILFSILPGATSKADVWIHPGFFQVD